MSDKKKTAYKKKSEPVFLWEQFPTYDSFLSYFNKKKVPRTEHVDTFYYYLQMEAYSNKGNKFISWWRAFLNWLNMDEQFRGGAKLTKYGQFLKAEEERKKQIAAHDNLMRETGVFSEPINNQYDEQQQSNFENIEGKLPEDIARVF